MDKQFFLAVADRIKQQVPRIRWIDLDEGQFSTSQRPPVAFPACLIDIAYIHCDTTTGGRQRIQATVTLRVAFLIEPTTNAAAPAYVRPAAMQRFDILESLHHALQWWSGGNLFNPLRRTTATPERTSNGLKVYRITYTTEFYD